MKHFTDAEEKCLSDALALVKDTAEKYALRRPFDAYTTDQSVAGDVLIGDIAHDRYVACTASSKKPLLHGH
ncbi:MAG TPA: hypothetical protein VGF97_00125 [Rhizomicrobium sp.]|jgi:hypothetical protein